jgi:hypothetical protein
MQRGRVKHRPTAGVNGIAKRLSKARSRSAVSQRSISTKQFKHQLAALTAGTLPSIVDVIRPLTTYHARRP